MTMPIFDIDEITRVVSRVYHDKNDGRIVVAAEQDVTALVEQNKALQNREGGPNRKAFMRRFASVPGHIYNHFTSLWRSQGMSSAEIREQWRKWHNDPDNAAWRVDNQRMKV
jgi:hypothetical protein